jgi:hypothetical protein
MAVIPANERFSIGRVISLTANLTVRNIFIFAPLAVGICAPLCLITILWNRYWFLWMRSPWGRFVDTSLVGDSLPFATSLTLSAALTPFVMRRLGQPERHQKIHGKFLHFVLTTLIFTAANTLFIALFTLGHRESNLLLRLPVLAIIVLFWVTIPVAIVERKPPIAAFARSVALTRRKFFSCLTLIGGSAAVFWLSISAMTAIFDPNSKHDTPVVVLAWAMLTGYFLVSSVMAIIAYHLLRIDRDGLATGDIGDVFD